AALPSGSPFGQGETGEAGFVGQVHAPTRIVPINRGYLRAVNGPNAQRLVHLHAVAIPPAGGVDAVRDHDFVAGRGGMHSGLMVSFLMIIKNELAGGPLETAPTVSSLVRHHLAADN